MIFYIFLRFLRIQARPWAAAMGAGLALLAMAGNTLAMGLMVEPSVPHCGMTAVALPLAPPAAAKRLDKSQAVQGKKDIAWAWLGTPTPRYPHTALGSVQHAASLHVLEAGPSGVLQEWVYTLPFHRVFEDLTVRLVDLDGDGRDEMIVVESDATRGSSTVVLGLRPAAKSTQKSRMEVVELARSPYAGSTFRWLNPVGVADFDGDGRLDLASVITPHIGGVLTLYHYRPPKLEPYARAMDTSNHRMGDPEQQLAVIVEHPTLRPTVIVPDMGLKALHALRWEANGQWKELADVKPMQARVQRLTPMPSGGCALLADGTWWRVNLAQ